jgi:hypothetical protein
MGLPHQRFQALLIDRAGAALHQRDLAGITVHARDLMAIHSRHTPVTSPT